MNFNNFTFNDGSHSDQDSFGIDVTTVPGDNTYDDCLPVTPDRRLALSTEQETLNVDLENCTAGPFSNNDDNLSFHIFMEQRPRDTSFN